MQAEDYNPHVQRIEAEHNYTAVPLSQRSRASLSEHSRVFPQWLQVVQDEPTTTLSIQKKAPDGVLNYASAVLNDGLLLLEVRDAIHEGDGPRLLRCWKLMMMYWRHGGHTKYALETLHLLGAIQTTQHQELLMNCCGAALLTIVVGLGTTYLLTCTWSTSIARLRIICLAWVQTYRNQASSEQANHCMRYCRFLPSLIIQVASIL